MTGAVVGAPAQASTVTLTPAAGMKATISYTAGRVPHIRSLSYAGAGYGYGWAIGKDNLCELADTYLTVRGERSRYVGGTARPGDGYGAASTNLSSDLHFTAINRSGVVEKLVANTAPLGPRREVRELVDGYVAGFNRAAREPHARCPGGIPVPTIAAIDVYRTMYALGTIGGGGQWVDATTAAAPPAAAAPPVAAAPPAGAPAAAAGTGTARNAADIPARSTATAAQAATLRATLTSRLSRIDMGSNGIAVGSEATTDGRSILLGNPHYPWYGGRRFYQAQLTVPGRMDVSGASLLGIPIVQIGFNANVAWTHTVATPRTFGFRELQLVPGDPTSYLVDGKPEKMTSRVVSVVVRAPDGSSSTVSRTLYSSRYGDLMAGTAALPLHWTTTTAYALQDANADNLRGLNTWFGYGQSTSVGQLRAVAGATLGIPWVNTIATDRAGNAMYADVQVVPGVPDALVDRCGTPLGKQIYPSTRIPILDGSTTGCAWTTDPDAVAPGLFGAARMPVSIRKDYVFNSNDSPWLANVEHPITGYPLIMGDIATPRSLRTRMGAAAITERLAGTDGLGGQGFSRTTMPKLLFADTSMAARLARTDTVAMCRSLAAGGAPTSTGAAVPVGAACDTLAAWDGSYRVDAVGALLFDRFWLRAQSAGAALWRTPFDAARPVSTPSGLNTSLPAVQQAFGDALAEVTPLGLTTRLGQRQTVTRAGATIPIHGGDERMGVLNKITGAWDPTKGYPDVWAGSSYIQVVGFDATACPKASTVLTYSQSTDVTSPAFADQTRLFSRSALQPSPFCYGDVWRAATSTVTIDGSASRPSTWPSSTGVPPNDSPRANR